MKYVMSDLHGEYEKYIKMLELIEFNDDDELYILGDIFDRNRQVLEIVEHIIKHKNIHLIKGNHEEFFENYIETGDTSIWFYNGGKESMEKLKRKDDVYLNALYRYIHSLPLCMVVDNYILVHAGIYLPKEYKSMKIEDILQMQTTDDLLWDRSNIGNEREIEGYTVICGHTPVQTIDEALINEPQIIKKKGYIDLKEFYI